MAGCSSSTVRYRLVDNQVAASAALQSLAASKLMALDCKGVHLSRHGELCTVQLRSFDPPDHMPFVYVFDVVALGRWLFDVAGLRQLLESEEVGKLMYDCRNDSDALQHQFGVRLAGVKDLQLLGFMVHPNAKRLLTGIGTALTNYVTGYSGGPMIMAVKKIFEEDGTIWKRRPIPDDLLEYCANDVFYLFDLLMYFVSKISKNKRGSYQRRWLIASKNYVDLMRSLPVLENSQYVRNPILPLRVIPDAASDQRGGFLPVEAYCDGCRRGFHQSEMRGSKCIVCHVISLGVLE